MIGNAVKVMRIATGEEAEELPDSAKSATAELGSRGGKARAARVSSVLRAGEQGRLVGDLDDLAEIHDGDALADVLDDREHASDKQ